MSEKAQKIMRRYIKYYVTDAQLVRYYELGIITKEEYDTIYATRH